MSTYGNNLLAQYYAQNQEQLPDEYMAVEWLEAPAGAYINVGIGPKTSQKAQIKALCTQGHIFGYRESIEIQNISIQRTAIDICNASNYSTFRCILNYLESSKAHIIYLSRDVRKWEEIDGTIVSSSSAVNEDTFTSDGPFYLFGINGYQSVGGPRIWYAILWGDNNRKVRHFCPCIRKSDGKPGMYDLCKSICPLTGTPFYINAGTGEFTTP